MEDADLYNIDINDLTDIEEIKKLHNAYLKKEQELDEELDQLLENHFTIEKKILSVQNLIPNLSVLTKEATHLTNTVVSTSSLAEKVSSKVRELDTTKSRVQEAIKRVDDILDLKSCVEGVQEAFKNEEYEQAAAFIHRYLSLDERAMREILPVDTEETDLNASFSYLREAQEKLQNAVRERFKEAVSVRNSSEVERFFKLFPLVGLQGEGLLNFSKYLRIQISETAEINIDTALKTGPQDRKANVIFADTLTLLFEHIAKVIEDQQPLVDTFYGPGHMLTVQKELQAECDSQSKHIIQEFLNSRKFDELCENLSKSAKQTKSSDNKIRVDPKDLDILLGEIVLLSSRTELYQSFIRKRIENDIDSLPEEEKSDEIAQVKDHLINNSGLSRKMQTLMGDYIIMECYFMKEMMLKAVSMDVTDVDSLTSSMVDDIFFVLQKSFRRTLSSKNVDIMCAVLNNASSIVMSEFLEIMKNKLKTTGFTASSIDLSGMFQSKVKLTETLDNKKNFLIGLNNIDVSCDYLKKLLEDNKDACEKLFHHDDVAKDKIESCLIEFGSSSQKLKEILQNGITQLCTNAILPKLNPLIDSFTSVSHVLNEDNYAQYEMNDPFVQKLIAMLDTTFKTLKGLLTQANYENCIGVTCHELSLRLEKAVLKSTFNRLGGLQFDKELRSLVQFLTSITEWTVRDKFARLSQTSTILNLEKVSELLDYWGENSGPLTWRLTPGEVRSVMGLRSDFRHEDIQRLKL